MSFEEQAPPKSPPKLRRFTKLQVHYVVVRGAIPGVYKSAGDVLDNILGIDGAYVQQFASRDLAVSAWRQILDRHQAVALKKIPSGSPVSVWKRVINNRFLNPGPPPTEASLTDSPISFADAAGSSDGSNVGVEWYEMNNSNASGVEWSDIIKNNRRWVVWSGRSPGIYNDWAEAHAQIHGVHNARFLCRLFPDQALAQRAWDWLSKEGLVSFPLGITPDYPSAIALELCEECGDGTQV